MTSKIGPLTEEIGGIIKGRMGRYDITQAQMAALVGVDQSQLSKMLRGLRAINLEQLEIMCQAIGLDMVALIAEAEKAVAERGMTREVPALVVSGVRVSGDTDDVMLGSLTAEEDQKLRNSGLALAAKRGRRK